MRENQTIEDWKEEINNFLKADDKHYLLFCEMLAQCSKRQLEKIEALMLKTIDSIKYKLAVCNVFNKNDLKDAEFLLKFIKSCIDNEEFETDMQISYLRAKGCIE